ncbi:putative sgs1 protein [Rhizophagus clarus]|uniref:DNA 3'-5' helicase n=1 Tax=Rhizophagus clarus TaxID=94130 RepID=A0A8H3KN01_9GLOM|nr:putative sgs1 protein [Rhizophagus clarus]
MYDKAKVYFVIDEAHCILDYDIHTSLGIQSKNFATIWGSSFECKEITIEVYKRRDNCKIFSNDLIDLIKKHERGRIIIYCVIQSGCNDLFMTLQPLLPDKSLGVYHRGIGDEQWQIIISDWKNSKIQIMIGTNAFGMGINSSDVCLVIHCVAPLNMNNISSPCLKCDNYRNQIKEQPTYENCVEDILHLLDTVEEINESSNCEITEDDVVEVFCKSNTKKFGNLVAHGYIEQKISLYYSSPNAQTLSMNMFIIGIKEGAKERAIVDSWYY